MLHIETRDYSSYYYESSISGEMLDPIQNKMLHGDKCENGEPIYCSPWRTQPIPGVLILGKTYGTLKGKLLYKFIPDCKHLPAFLVPYEIKASFCKAYKNKYAVIVFKEWPKAPSAPTDKVSLTPSTSFPLGTLTETLGDVDSLEAFCEYQLHRRNLVQSLAKFTSHVKVALKDEAQCIATIQQRHSVPQITGEYIFSIDPATSLDYDDAFSVKRTSDTTYRVTVYIANVYLWLETFDLFKYMTSRVSTIYLPDKKRPMLPPLLSDNYCSLKAGAQRFVYTYSQEFDIGSGQATGEPTFGQGLAKINKNCDYEDPNLDKVNGYSVLKQLSNCADSHDVVAYWMIKMNVECAKRGTAIYRGTVTNDDSLSAQYSLEPLPHKSLNQNKYTHITSPIRRLVDIINQATTNNELEHWTAKLDYINEQCRQIKRAQMDCDLLAFSMNAPADATYEGTIVDVYNNEYCIQLDCGLRTRMKTVSRHLEVGSKPLEKRLLEVGSRHTFKIFVFNDEHTLSKKVKLVCLEK